VNFSFKNFNHTAVVATLESQVGGYFSMMTRHFSSQAINYLSVNYVISLQLVLVLVYSSAYMALSTSSSVAESIGRSLLSISSSSSRTSTSSLFTCSSYCLCCSSRLERDTPFCCWCPLGGTSRDDPGKSSSLWSESWIVANLGVGQMVTIMVYSGTERSRDKSDLVPRK